MTKYTRMMMGFGLALLTGCATGAQGMQTAGIGHDCAGLDDAGGQVADLYADRISAVKPVHEDQFLARAIERRFVAGAEMYVPGEQGMNAAYLDRLMSCHAHSGVAATHPNDPARVEGVDRVEVDTVGSSYRITVTSKDREAGKAIWERAQRLKEGGSVQVRQLAAAPMAGNAL